MAEALSGEGLFDEALRQAVDEGRVSVSGETELWRRLGLLDDAAGVRRLYTPAMLADLLAQTLMNSEIGGVQVLIGGEGRWEELNDFSLVLARYGTPNAASGYLGVLGPIRMAYGRAVSTVDYVAGLLSGMMAETMNTQD